MTVYLWGFGLVFAAIIAFSVAFDDMDTDRPFTAFLIALIWPAALALVAAAMIHELYKRATR